MRTRQLFKVASFALALHVRNVAITTKSGENTFIPNVFNDTYDSKDVGGISITPHLECETVMSHSSPAYLSQ